jgi:hypothetical protein
MCVRFPLQDNMYSANSAAHVFVIFSRMVDSILLQHLAYNIGRVDSQQNLGSFALNAIHERKYISDLQRTRRPPPLSDFTSQTKSCSKSSNACIRPTDNSIVSGRPATSPLGRWLGQLVKSKEPCYGTVNSGFPV